MHVLVLKLVIVYSSYGLSKFASKAAHFRKNRKAIAFGLVKIDQSQIFDLYIPSDRPCQELLNACFSFEIGNCILKLCPLKVCLKNKLSSTTY